MFTGLSIEIGDMGFSKACFFTSEGDRVERYVTAAEAEKARQVIESGDPYKIDNFCYRIY